MKIRLQARQELLSVQNGAVVYAEYAPASGESAKILAAWASHDDVAARDTCFGLVDALSSVASDMHDVVNIAAGVDIHLYGNTYFTEPLILRAGHALRCNVTGLDHAGGKKVTLYVIVERILGEEQYAA